MNRLYIVVALELFIGGGGRLTEIGPITLRMLLFAVVMATIGACIWVRPHRRGPILTGMIWVLAYLTIHVLALLRGSMNGAGLSDIFADLQPTLYWLTAPFFALVLSKNSNITRTGYLVLSAGLILSIAYFAIIAVVMLGYIDPFELWEIFLPSGEFFYRNPLLFFYKGDLYLGIAIIFLVSGWRSHPWLLMLIATALLLTLTRGFVLAVIISTLLMLRVQGRGRSLIWLLGITAALVFGLQFILDSGDPTVLGDRTTADGQRINDILFMIDRFGLDTLLIGEGFGSLINSRMNVETSYLWMLWKGGVPMLTFWMLPLLVSFLAFRRIPRGSEDFSIGCAFFFSTVFIYIQTATNPFLNNPIGLSFVMISMFALDTLARKSRPRGLPSIRHRRKSLMESATPRLTA